MSPRLLSRVLPLAAVALTVSCLPPAANPRHLGASPALAVAHAAAPSPSLLDTYTIPLQPEWTDKYINSDPKADVRYFRMKKLMADFGLSRFQAVELQNHYRDLTRAGVSQLQAFHDALSAVRSFRAGSGIDAKRLEQAPFIVILDLDETLFQRSPVYKSGSRGAGWADFSFPTNGDTAHVKLRPGWEQIIRRIHELQGMVILFTASPDDIAEGVASRWSSGGQNILSLVDGMMSKSHLILQEKGEGDPIVLPSKDLRVFDESLARVIIVDDNPKLVVQHNRQRLIKKFQADPYLVAKHGGPGLSAPFEQALPAVLHEIEESVTYMNAKKVAFGQAFLPYTMLGQLAMESLIQSGMKPEAARAYIRENPAFVDEKF